VDFDRVYRRLYNFLYAYHGGQVKNEVHLLDQRLELRQIQDGAQGEVESAIVLQRYDVFDTPRRKIVDNEYFISPLQQRFAQMASDKARATRDQNFPRFHALIRCKLTA